MTMCISALGLTTLDSVARIGRMSFQELFLDEETDKSKLSKVVKFLTNDYVATLITLALGLLLAFGGYNSVWPLFGSANQLLSALVLITLAVFLRVTGRKGIYALGTNGNYVNSNTYFFSTSNNYNIRKIICNWRFCILTDGLQLIFAILLMVLGVLVALSSFEKLFGKEEKKFKHKIKLQNLNIKSIII